MESFLPDMDDNPTGRKRAFRASSSSLVKSLATSFKFNSSSAVDSSAPDARTPPSPTLPYFDKYPRSSSRAASFVQEREGGKGKHRERDSLRSPAPPVVDRKRERTERVRTPIPSSSTSRALDRPPRSPAPPPPPPPPDRPARASAPLPPRTPPKSPIPPTTTPPSRRSLNQRSATPLSSRSLPRAPDIVPLPRTSPSYPTPTSTSRTRTSMSPLHRSEHSDSSHDTIPATPPFLGLVAEPFPASVEAMDALVDQMNGDGGMARSSSSALLYKPPSSKRRGEKYARNPLYAPPLPKPPEGITLGIRARKISEDSIDGPSYPEQPPPPPPPRVSQDSKRERVKDRDREKEKEKERKERKAREMKERIRERDRDVERQKERGREKSRERERRAREREEEGETNGERAGEEGRVVVQEERVVPALLNSDRPAERESSRAREKRREADPERESARRKGKQRDVEADPGAVRAKERRRDIIAEEPRSKELLEGPATVLPRSRSPLPPPTLSPPPPTTTTTTLPRSRSSLPTPTRTSAPSTLRSPPSQPQPQPQPQPLPRSKPFSNIYALSPPDKDNDKVISANPSMENVIRNFVSRGDSPGLVGRVSPKWTGNGHGNGKARVDIACKYDLEPFPSVSPTETTPTKPVPPSISDIIRTHGPAVRHASATSSRPSLSARTSSFPAPAALPPPAEHPTDEDEALTNRSSMDSITEEVRRALKASIGTRPQPLHQARSFPTRRSSSISRAMSLPNGEHEPSSATAPGPPRGPLSEGYAPSIESTIPAAGGVSFLPLPSSAVKAASSETLAVAQHLRSPRLTRLLTLKRSPHRGLTVSLADVGSSTGHPVFVFLGLGCVRYLVGLYDEMAEALGLRLVCVDRWGLGKTDDVPPEKRGLLEWAGVMEEVADMLEIDEFSLMAHSAGAPYSLATSLRLGRRVVGSVHLLAPWVSTAVEGGYKWLKYVPNGLIKGAQAAEWKVQGWMLGKPPTITYQGIGYDMKDGAITTGQDGRPSFQFSDYDDLADFDGRFGSHVSLPAPVQEKQDVQAPPPPPPVPPIPKSPVLPPAVKRKTSRSILGIFGAKGSASRSPKSSTSPNSNPPTIKANGKGIMSRRQSTAAQSTKSVVAMSVVLPTIETDQVGLGLKFEKTEDSSDHNSVHPLRKSEGPAPTTSMFPRAGRRSISLTSRSSARASNFVSPPLPSPRLIHRAATTPATPVLRPTNRPITLADALMRASHAESLKGGTADLLAILERDSKPWGFAYTDVRHPVLVWYGERDEKISIGSVRWMERAMHECKVKVVPGVGHSLLTNAQVVVDVLESIAREQGSQHL